MHEFTPTPPLSFGPSVSFIEGKRTKLKDGTFTLAVPQDDLVPLDACARRRLCLEPWPGFGRVLVDEVLEII